MKKKTFLFLLVALLLVAVGVASAQIGPQGGGFWFGATHQNVGTGTATVSVTAYDSASSSTYPYSTSIASGAALNIGPSDIPSLPAGFVGSIVTSSDEPLVALVNLTNREAGGNGISGGKAAAIYNGIGSSSPNTDLEFPLAKYNHFNKTTTFYLQNAGSSTTTVDVTFNIGGTAYPYTTSSISPGQMVAVDAGLAGVTGTNNIGAMSMTASEPIAGVMLEHEHTATVATVLQGSSGFAPGEIEQTIYCPTYKQNHFGRKSGLQVQNLHTSAQDITATFVSGGSSFVSTKTSVASGASVTFIDVPEITSGTLFAATVVGADGLVAGIVNEAELPLLNTNQTSTTYNCQAASTASTTVSYPAYKENRFGRTTALQIQNVGGSAATNIVLSFTDNNGDTHTTSAQTIAAGDSSVYVCASAKSIWSGSSLPASTLSGVTITSDQDIIVVANEASWTSVSPCTPNNGSSSFDKSTTNGFNLP
ncbi:MAG: hypothetical protein GY796_22260 [Chloroflexi bacterium]|nr:hypothetical protein [Chloroflexota bacterium]